MLFSPAYLEFAHQTTFRVTHPKKNSQQILFQNYKSIFSINPKTLKINFKISLKDKIDNYYYCDRHHLLFYTKIGKPFDIMVLEVIRRRVFARRELNYEIESFCRETQTNQRSLRVAGLSGTYSAEEYYEFYVFWGELNGDHFLSVIGTEYFNPELIVFEMLGHILSGVLSARIVKFDKETSSGVLIIQGPEQFLLARFCMDDGRRDITRRFKSSRFEILRQVDY